MTDSFKQIRTSQEGGGSGSLTDMVSSSDRGVREVRLDRIALIKFLALALIVAAMNYQQFPSLIRGWFKSDSNWTHGPLIPLFSLYLLFVRRDEIFSAPRRVCVWGLPVLLLGAALQVCAYWIRNPLSAQLSMLILIFGLVLYLAGPRMAKLTWLPIFFMVFAFPIPSIYYTRVAIPLQHLAAQGSSVLLTLMGVKVSAIASKLDIVSVTGQFHPLVVAEACAGMRLLMAFPALAVATAYLEDRPLWHRVVMVVMSIPIAIACNILRVTITGVMYAIDKPELGHGFMHDFTGLLMLIPAFGMLWLIGWLLAGFNAEDDEEENKHENFSRLNVAEGNEKRQSQGATDSSELPPGQRLVQLAAKNRHLIVALLVLVMTGGGIYGFGWVEKKPVPWPENIRVNEDYRLLSLPKKFGPFEMVDRDRDDDGMPDGEKIFDEKLLAQLGIGDWIDQNRYENRRSNWYVSRIYEDTRITGNNNPYRFWQVDVYYYTGRRDLAPHVPERCLAVAGNEILGEGSISLAVPGGPRPWDDEIKFQRVGFRPLSDEGSSSYRGVQYYTFSLNGQPEWSWEIVRWELAKPWVDYCYFAKIQFTPQGNIKDMERADKRVKEIIKLAMPDILDTIRMPAQFNQFRSAENVEKDNNRK